MHERIEIDSVEVRAGFISTIGCNNLRARSIPMFDPPDREGERSAAVREGHAESRQPIQHAAQNQRADRKTRLGRHSHQPRQPVLLHAFLAEHFPRMNENRSVELRRCFQDRNHGRVVEVAAVDVGADLDPGQTELIHAPLKFFGRQLLILHWDCAQTNEALRVFTTYFGDVIVE